MRPTSASSVNGSILSFWKQVPLPLLALGFAVVAFALRFALIDTRPMHHDEAVNHFFVGQVFEHSYYPYSHENYHGPLYFYLLSMVVALLGDSEWALRGLSAFFGALLAALPLFFMRTLFSSKDASSHSWKSAISLAVALSLSPSLVFFSRYAIHEALFVFLQLLFACLVFRTIYRREASDWLWLGVIAAFLIATKETAVIFFACFAIGLLTANFIPVYSCVREKPKSIVLSILVASVVTVAIFTAGFRWWDGLYELALTVPQWIGRGTVSDTGHFKPIHYYLSNIAWPHDPVLLLAVAAATWTILRKFLKLESNAPNVSPSEAIFQTVSIWGLLSLIVYSLIPYKTPWLYLNFAVPLILVLGFRFGHVDRSSNAGRVFWWLSVFCFLISLRSAILFNYPPINGLRWLGQSYPYGDENPFSYVNSARDLVEVTSTIGSILEANPEARVSVVCSSYWPIPYYLREWSDRIGYPADGIMPDRLEENLILIAPPGATGAEFGGVKHLFRVNTAAECELITPFDKKH